jgi:hypothetical protein
VPYQHPTRPLPSKSLIIPAIHIRILTSYSKHFQGGVVTVVIGSTKKSFTVHKDLLIFYSDYFRAAFNGSFIEAIDKKINLLDTDQKAFEHFYAWLYTRKLASEDDKPLSWDNLFDLWVFGDRFQVPLLQNSVIDEMFAKEKRDDTFQLHMIKPVYEKTVDGSLLRKVMIEFVAHGMCLSDDDDGAMSVVYHQYYTVEILSDVVKELETSRKKKVPYGKTPKRDKCFFHVHGKDEHC